MKIREVFVLEEALEDLLIGNDFYEEQEEGIGDYFSSSLLSDIKSGSSAKSGGELRFRQVSKLM